jgi:methyl-accepting chemotaxis protein
VAECFLQVGDIWESFRLTAKTIESGATSMDQAATSVLDAGKMLTEQIEVSNRITWQLNSISEKITETGQSVAEAGRFLQDSSRELIPMYRSIQTGVEGLDRSLGSLYPALESARDLQLTIKAADLVFRNIDNQVSGMASSMHDEIRSASDRMVSNQQKVLLEGIAPPLTTIGRTMDLLLLLIDRTEQLLRNLPIAVPAKRIVDDLQAAGVAHLAAAERDAKSVADVSERLASTESRMDEVLNELKAAHSQIATSLKELEIETADLARNVGEVSSHIDGPFWKKLGGRKP